MVSKLRIFLAWLIVALFIFLQGFNAVGNQTSNPIDEPIISDNLDGNWTATWKLDNPDNFTLSNIELNNGEATLHLNTLHLIEDTMTEFRNGTWDGLMVHGNQGIGLDLRRNSYTLIADKGNNRAVEIDYDKWFWQYGSNISSGYGLNKLKKPSFAVRLNGGRTLITDTDNNRVIEVGRDGQFLWQYGSNTTSGIGDNLLNKPTSAVPLGNGNILIADTGNNYVVEVTRDKHWVWQYGIPDMGDPKPSESVLDNPTFAQELPGGNILITDRGNHRVFEVTSADTIIWQYGTGLPGVTLGRLDTPTYAIKLNSGGSGSNTLISDTDNHRVIEVTPTGKISWLYGRNKTSGVSNNRLNLPTCAIRLPNGNTLITDSGNHRVIEGNPAKNVVWQYGTNSTSGYGENYLNSPTSALPIKKDYILGVFMSQVLDGGEKTNWSNIEWIGNTPQNTAVLFYTRTGESPSVLTGSWSEWSNEYINSTGENITSPMNRYIQYAAIFITFDLNVTPTLKKVIITGTRYESQGELITQFFRPKGLVRWNHFNSIGRLKGQSIIPYYSLGEFHSWKKVPGTGGMDNIPIDTGEIRFKFAFSTFDISISPILDEFSLNYEALGELNNIIVTPTSVEVMVGKKIEFHAVGFDAYGHRLEIEPEWSTTVGVMEANNLIAQTVVGSGYVNATSDDMVGSATVNILPGPLDHIVVKPEVLTILAGEKYEFLAFGYDEFGNEVQINPEWKTDVGSMDGNLFIAQNFAGRGTVKATVEEIAGDAIVTVELNSSKHHPPKILSRVPDQIRPEDSEPWVLNLAIFEWDEEDPGDNLLWYLTKVDTSLYTVTGAYSKVDELTFIPKPDAFGNNQATLWLKDSDNMTTSQPLWINITPVNDKPEINNPPDISIHYDEPYTFDYGNYIRDKETPDNKLILTLQEPAGQKYTMVNGLNVTYNYPQTMFGEKILLTLMVSDGEAVEHDNIQISITDNHAPLLIKPFNDIIMSEGEIKNFAIKLDNHFMDPDSDPLTFFYTAEYLIVNLHENNSVTITSPSTWSGIETITFRAVDPFGGMAEGTVKVFVNEVNDPPKISKIPDIFVHYDYEYQFNLSKYVTDPDNETYELIFWTTDSENISFHEPDNSVMRLYYPESLLGQKIWVMLYVSDGIAITTGEFWVHVTDNFPPLIKKELTDVYFDEDSHIFSAFNLNDYFMDEDDEQLCFSFNLIDCENITVKVNDNNTVDFISKQDWSGSSVVIFHAEDKNHAFIESSIKVVVIPVNDAPIMKPIPSQNGKVGERWVLDLSEYMSDVDNELTELELTVPPEYSELIIITGYQLTFFADKSFNDNIEITVSDGVNNVTSEIELIVSKNKPITDSMILWVWVLLLIIILIILLTIIGVIRRKRGSFEVTDVFIIHRNGVLIKYIGDTLRQDADEDIISGMLTAVQAFVSDSFAAGSNKKKDEWELNQLRMGGHEIMFEQGKHVLITVIYEGKAGERLTKLLSLAVTKVEEKYGDVLENWKGRFDQLGGIEDEALAILCPKKSDSDDSEESIKDSEVINIDDIQVPLTSKPEQLPTQTNDQLPQLPPHQPTISEPLPKISPESPIVNPTLELTVAKENE